MVGGLASRSRRIDPESTRRKGTDVAGYCRAEGVGTNWKEFRYDAEDTIRFYALRLHETGFIKSSPQKIIAEYTDWRFFNELKRELKV